MGINNLLTQVFWSLKPFHVANSGHLHARGRAW